MLVRMVKELKRLSGPCNLGNQARNIFICAFNDHNNQGKSQKSGLESDGSNCPTSGGSGPEVAEQDPSTKPANSPPAFNPIWQTYKGKTYVKPKYEWDFSKEECCPQCEAFRFDMHYYKPGNLNRTYQRTWWECTPRMVPRRVCCQCDAVPPEVERRTRQTKVHPQGRSAGCTAEHGKDSRGSSFKGCSQFKMPACRVSRLPPCCKIFPHPSKCVKTKCPFPSYSECIQEDPAVIPGRSKQCRCLDYVPICVRLRRAKHMALHNIALYPCEHHEKGKKKRRKT